MLEKAPFPYGGGFRSLDRKTLDPVRLSVRAEWPSGSKKRCSAPIVDVWTLPYLGLYTEAAIHNARQVQTALAFTSNPPRP